MTTNLKIGATLLALLSLAISGKVFAQAVPVGSLPTKVAVVAIQDAIANTNEGKREFNALQTRFAPQMAAFKAQNDEVEGLQKQLQTDSAKLSQDEQFKRAATISGKQRELQRAYEGVQNEAQQAEQEVMSRLGKKMLDVLDKFARSHGFTMVMDVSSPQTPVLWVHPSTEITKELVAAYDAATPDAAASPKKP
jgi:outer membrane protein